MVDALPSSRTTVPTTTMTIGSAFRMPVPRMRPGIRKNAMMTEDRRSDYSSDMRNRFCHNALCQQNPFRL